MDEQILMDEEQVESPETEAEGLGSDVAAGLSMDAPDVGDGIADALGVFSDSAEAEADADPDVDANPDADGSLDVEPNPSPPPSPTEEGSTSKKTRGAEVLNLDGREYEIGNGPGQLSASQAAHLERVERTRREFQARADRSEAELARVAERLERLEQPAAAQQQQPEAAQAQSAPQQRTKVPLPEAIAQRAATIDRETGFEEEGDGVKALVEDLWSELLTQYVAPLARRVSESQAATQTASLDEAEREQVRNLTETNDDARGLDPEELFAAYRARQAMLAEDEGLPLQKVLESQAFRRVAIQDAVQYLREYGGESGEEVDSQPEDDVRYKRRPAPAVARGGRGTTAPRMGSTTRAQGSGRGLDFIRSADDLIHGAQ